MKDSEAPQELVAGKYRLTRLLGRGGMGSVWEGVHASLGTRVAVKRIDAEYAQSPEALARFQNEARAAATLRSKHVVDVYDHGVTEDGRPFIVMEFLEGEPLDQRLERVGRLLPRDTARILLQVGRGLSKAHAAGIVHRDLKPENIFLVWDEEDGADIPKVVDFGIAKFTDTSLGASSATRTGSVLGTPYYMSPEQARGLRTVDHRSDVWSMGVIAYRCIVGELPFMGEAVGDLLVKLCTAPIPVPSQMAPGVPPGFDAFVARALNRDPEERFQSVTELTASLAAICGLSGTLPEPSGMGRAATPGFYPGQPTPQPHAATGAPVTQTPDLGARRGRTGLIVAGLSGLAVLGVIGVVLAGSLVGSLASPEPAASSASPEPAEPPPVVQAAPSEAPPPRAVEPEPSAAAQPSTALEPSAKPKNPAPKPRPVTRPAPRPRAPRRPASPKPIDLGY